MRKSPAGIYPLCVAPLLAAITLAGCFSTSKPPLPLAENVDLNRMYGGWFLIATIPNRFEKGLVAPYDVYSKRPDGDIREDFYTQVGGFEAERKHFVVHDWVKDGTNNAFWWVEPIWPITLPFLILYVDPDYRYVLYGENNREVGWIYARTQTIPDADYDALRARFAAAGYDSTIFRKFVQRPEDIGQTAYWSDEIHQ